jgi:beta-lactamase class D
VSHRRLIIASALVLATLGSVSAARDTQKAASASCVMIQELTTARTLVQRGSCSTRLSPASTFKIPHALVALETGVVTIDAVERWDGTRY